MLQEPCSTFYLYKPLLSTRDGNNPYMPSYLTIYSIFHRYLLFGGNVFSKKQAFGEKLKTRHSVFQSGDYL